MRQYADLVALHLVGPTTVVLGSCGGEAFVRLEFGVFVMAPAHTFLEFEFVAFEVILHTLQFASEMLFLSRSDGLEFPGHFLLERGSQQLTQAGVA